MKRKVGLWVVGIGVLLSGVVVLLCLRVAARDRRDLQEQLRLAKADGLPTDAAEFAATIKPAAPAENAASLYRSLARFRESVDYPRSIQEELFTHPCPTSLAAAIGRIERDKEFLSVVDKAAAKPRCWFDRNWSDGVAVLMPEFADMKKGALEVGLRGSVAAAEGRVKDALADANEMLAISKHAGEEDTEISALVEQAIYVIAMRELAMWSFQHRDRPEYCRALRSALKSFPKPNVLVEKRGVLLEVLSAIDLTATHQGRAKLGLGDHEDSAASALLAFFISKARARVDIVKAERDYWNALKLPRNERTPKLADAEARLYRGLLAFPTAGRTYEMLTSGQNDSGEDDISEREDQWRAEEVEYTALGRALSSRAIPSSIKTSDLINPWTGGELHYDFDGRRIQISLVRPGDVEPLGLWIPPLERSAGKSAK